MKEVDIISKVVGRDTSGKAATFIPGAGAPSVNLDDYLLKKIWDSVFEIRTDSEGNPYLFEKMPFVTQYGITMYDDGGELNLPSIYAGIPFDNKTIWLNPETGLVEVLGGTGGGVSNFWDLSNIPSWITATKPKYSYSEIEGTPDLSGYATETYVEDRLDDLINGAPAAYDTLKEIADVLQGNVNSIGDIITTIGTKADKATTLAGYGITDAYTKSAVDTLLGDYVTLGTTQTITGEKNFTGGLKVNGSPIVYDATNKYWKLEGDLLVTGGVTMFASDSAFTPSTIMDGLVLDGATLGINDEGQLYVKGGAGGGLTEVYWDDVKDKPTFAAVATSGKYSDLSGVPTLLSSFTNDVGYLKSHQTIYNLTMQAGAFSAKTFDPNGAAMTVNIPTTTSHISEGSNLYFTNARAVSALASTLSGYLPLSGGTMEGDIFLPVGKYIKNPSTTYAILGVGADNTVICGEPKNPLHLRGTQVNIPQKTFIEGNGANIITLKRNNANGGAFCFYKAMNQDELGWIAGSDSGHEFIFNYTSDGLSTNTNLLRLTTEGHLFNKGNVIIGSVEKTNNVVALNVLGKGWFSSGVKLKNDTSSYNTNGITFSSTVGGSILGRIGGDTYGNIGVFPTGTFDVRPGYTGTGTGYGLTVDGRGSVVIDFTTNQVGLWLRQKSNNLAWMAYAPSNQTTNVWVIGAETDNIFRMRYSSDGLSTTPTTKFALNTNGLLSTVMGLQVNGATVISTTIPSIALPFSSYVSFGGYHALRGETNAVVLCAPVSESGAVILRPNGNASTKYQFSINSLGEAVLSSGSAASLTINRTVQTGGAYIRYNAAGQTTYGWVAGSGPNHTYQCQYFNGSSYYIKSELDSSGNLLVYGGITMYSDQRKKTILRDVELSLKQIADAPLIEHYYNSDSNKTTHVGSIAQYWAGMNDWFCKLDGEGFYTMEIQNAALASAISIARELVRYESKTDRTIRKLKQRISELEDEVERLKMN